MPTSARRRLAGEQGQVLPLVVLLLVLAAGTAIVVAQVGRVVDDRARAATAADAAALAGAAEGRTAAEDLARRNGAVLEDFDQDGDDTVVVVRVGRATARARARRAAGSSIATWTPP